MAETKLSFEEKNNRLKEIVSLLQDKDTTFTQSVMLYEEGIKLSKNCIKELKSAKGKLIEIQEIIDKTEGEF